MRRPTLGWLAALRRQRLNHLPADPLRAIPASRHPFQVWVMAAMAVAGFANVAGYTEPGSINAVLPRTYVFLWGMTMLLGGVLTLVAAWWPDRIYGLLIERTALLAVAIACLVYGVGVLYLFPRVGVVTGCLTIGIAAASLWRIKHVKQELARLSAWVERHYQ